MRLLQVIPYYYPATSFGGPLTVCQALSEEMVRRGHEVSVLTTDVASRTERCVVSSETIHGVSVTRIRNLSQTLVGRTNVYLPFASGEATDRGLEKADCVHVHEFFNYLSLAAVHRAYKRGVPTVLSGHAGMSLDPARGRSFSKSVIFRLFGRSCIDQVNAVQAATLAEADTCRKMGVASEKIHLIPNGVNLPPPVGSAERFRQTHGLGERMVALFVGRMHTLKGIDLIFAAAQELPNVCFVLVGPSENRPDVATPGWRTANIYIAGKLTGQTLADAYTAASMFVLPSFAEGLPMTALEALSYGVPSILSSACNLPEVADAGAGIMISATTAGLLGGVRSMLQQRDRWVFMQQAARDLVKARFELCQVHDEYERLYRKLTDGESAAYN